MEAAVIVNADDLGASHQVNRAIFALIDRGRVTSATLLANFPAAEEAARESRRFNKASFGVHLNASDRFPLAPTPALRPILNPDGSFAGNRLREVSIDRSLREALLVEWSAQIQRLLDLGVQVTHMDSHHHMHTVPGVFMVIKRLQRRFNIGRVRASMNIYSESQRLRSQTILPRKYLWNTAMRHLGATSTTDGFTSLEVFVQASSERKLNFRTLEIMVHPGNPAFSDETKMLVGNWEGNLPFPIKLISYSEL